MTGVWLPLLVALAGLCAVEVGDRRDRVPRDPAGLNPTGRPRRPSARRRRRQTKQIAAQQPRKGPAR